MSNVTISKAIEHITGPEAPEGALGKAVKKAKRRLHSVPVHDDPAAELRRLVRLHKNHTNTKVRLHHMRSDRTNQETGETIPCTLPDDIREDLKAAEKRIADHNTMLETEMTRALRQLPIYQHFLSKVFGCGPVVAAYLCAMVRIDRAPKISNLIRYCGYAVDPNTHRLERRVGAPKHNPDGTLNPEGTGTFNDDLRRCIWQMLAAMWKNAAKKTAKAPHGQTTKYLTRWREAKHGALSAGKPKGFAHKKGMHKAAALFIEDLYTVWRAMEGLPVWPSYHAAKLGYAHGGKVCVNEPKLLTFDEALALVGNVGGAPLSAPIADQDEELPIDIE